MTVTAAGGSGAATSTAGSGRLSWGELEQLWIDAGGSPAAAPLAASVAMAESGGRISAANVNSNGTVDRGLWQINSVHGAASTFDPLANARAAVSISDNGVTWAPWCTAWSDAACGTRGGSAPPAGGVALGSPAASALGGALNSAGISAGQITAERPKGQWSGLPAATGGAECVAGGGVLPCLLHRSELRALQGGLLVLGGVVLLITGVLVATHKGGSPVVQVIGGGLDRATLGVGGRAAEAVHTAARGAPVTAVAA